ncbi:hypothetical protein [Mycolicibacter heraklionensis]|jgi:hypothetical protein|uniref:hypothetical protein n=1 Tax=Mycolicibacter heraklionensis TaxID=512402 RepID=UPI0007F013B4|nr:hypothetical protein [Mycolicibacter heraklionensis]OBJ32466.1 hypothetical protein A5631_08860 [Mycolicibacter heraklionensis]
MSTYLVSYDLSKPNRSYEDLFKLLRSFGGYAKALESVWFVRSDLSTVEVRDRIWTVMDSDDHLLVSSLNGGGSAWCNLTSEVSDWLKRTPVA